MSPPLQPTYYEILQITPQAIDSQNTPEASQTFIKRAYRRALLSHHPDKQQNEPTTTSPPKYTIDQISLAYATLSIPSQRASYNRQLQTHSSTSGTTTTLFQTGIENVDLDDLSTFEDESTSLTKWFAPCRCGNSQGFLFSEEDLEDAADLGELMVGCADCSLWLRVHFAVAVEEEGGDGEMSREQREGLDESSSRTPKSSSKGISGTGVLGSSG